VHGATALIFHSPLLKHLTLPGLFFSTFLGINLLSALGPAGWSIAAIYFVFGSAITKLGASKKEALGIAEKRGGRRGPENVFGSALTGLSLALASASSVFGAAKKTRELIAIGYVASFATKLSDTFASEFGKAFGSATYSSLPPFRRVKAGTEGAVSLEGTIGGVVGALILVLYANWLGFLGVGAGVGVGVGGKTSWVVVGKVVVSAVGATFVESWIGAGLQNKLRLSNEVRVSEREDSMKCEVREVATT